MNAAKRGTLLTLATVLTAVMTGWANAQIYKTVDEDGNVVYTDQPPTPDSQPITVRELSVIEVPEYTYRRKGDRDDESGAGEGEMSLSELRRVYRDFQLVSPMPEQSFWGTGNTATISWQAGSPLLEGMAVVYHIDGQAQPPTIEPMISTAPLDRGEHQVRAELVDARGRQIASAGPVTFFVRQQSRLFNRPGGG